jgi:predicted DNA-binding transcriptional regulator AlpA
MTSTARHTPAETPRLLSAPRLAAYLGRSPSWLYEHLPELRARGFPAKVEVFDAWDRRAVDAWLDRRSGLLPAPTAPADEGWTL